MNDVIETSAAPRPMGHYPHARRAGDLLFLSGIGPRDPATNGILGDVHDVDGNLISYDIESQTRAVFANVREVLHASGASLSDLVDVTVYLTNMAHDFKGYNAVWAEFFPVIGRAPCRTTIGITALPSPIAIELKCIAVIDRDNKD